MLLSYLKSVIRSLFKERNSLAISLLGLVIGLATTMLILLYVNYEFSFDRFHTNGDRVFRLYTETVGSGTTGVKTPATLGQLLKDNYSQVENTVRIAPVEKILVSYADQNFNESGLILADPSFLKVFTFPIKTDEALTNPYSIVLTRSMATKYFGQANPVGQIIRIGNKIDLTVTGIIGDIPTNSHFHFDFLAPIMLADVLFGKEFLEQPINTTVFTYLLLQPKSELSETTMQEVTAKYSKYPGSQFHVQPLNKIHLYSNGFGEWEPNSSIEYIRILIGFGLLVLIIACINYINLSAALYSKRLRKIGMIKVIGAGRSQLVRMFFMEALTLTSIAAFLSIILVKYLLPYFNALVRRPLILNLTDYNLVVPLALIVLSISIIVAAYPAAFISGQKAYHLLKSVSFAGNPGTLRKAIMIFQFTVAIVMIAITFTMNDQINYIQTKDLGFSKEALIVLPLPENSVRSEQNVFKSEVLGNSFVSKATGASDIPGTMKWFTSVGHKGLAENEKLPTMAFLYSDSEFIETFNAQIAQGTDFSQSPGAEEIEFIINESAVKFLGEADPIGMELSPAMRKKGKVVGVVRDFHFKSLHQPIEPLFIANSTEPFRYVFLRIDGSDIRRNLGTIEKAWQAIFPDSPFEFFFYDQYLDELYKSELRFSKITLITSLLSISITCLGLFGLAAFSSQQRQKEIALRKVFGASISNILSVLSKPYVKIILVAEILAIPIAYYFVEEWLGTFVYHVNVSPWIFLTSGAIVILLSGLTISRQSLKAAMVNPIKWIRYE